MGIVKDVVTGFTGAKAAGRAANVQQAAADRGAAETRAAGEEAVAGLDPFAKAGEKAITGLETGLTDLQRLVSDPEAQRDFITESPFFDALAERAEQDLFANEAARGKVGSGGTAEALQNSLVLLGSNLLNQNITQRQNVNSQFQSLVNTGLTAAGKKSNVLTGTAERASDFGIQAANAQAAGIVGKQNARAKIGTDVENRLIDAAKTAVTGGISL